MLISNSLAVTRYLLGGSDSVTKGGSPPGGTLTPPVVVSLWTAKTSVCFGSGSAITVYARNSCPRGAGQGKCSANPAAVARQLGCLRCEKYRHPTSQVRHQQHHHHRRLGRGDVRTFYRWGGILADDDGDRASAKRPGDPTL